MILDKYKDLPESMKNESVKKYYNMLNKRKISLIIKRVFDILLSLILILILLPVMIIIAILIKLDSKGNVIYKQERITKYR